MEWRWEDDRLQYSLRIGLLELILQLKFTCVRVFLRVSVLSSLITRKVQRSDRVHWLLVRSRLPVATTAFSWLRTQFTILRVHALCQHCFFLFPVRCNSSSEFWQPAYSRLCNYTSTSRRYDHLISYQSVKRPNSFILANFHLFGSM